MLTCRPSLPACEGLRLAFLQGQAERRGSGSPGPLGFCPLISPTPFCTDDQNATCVKPEELSGWPISQVGNPLRYMCLTHLDRRDYVFLLLVGFCIFAAGTVAAWLTGVCAVLYQNARRRSSEDEADDEAGHKVEVGRRIFQTSRDPSFPHLI